MSFILIFLDWLEGFFWGFLRDFIREFPAPYPRKYMSNFSPILTNFWESLIFYRILNLKSVKNLKSAKQKYLTAIYLLIFAWLILNFWQILDLKFGKKLAIGLSQKFDSVCETSLTIERIIWEAIFSLLLSPIFSNFSLYKLSQIFSPNYSSFMRNHG